MRDMQDKMTAMLRRTHFKLSPAETVLLQS